MEDYFTQATYKHNNGDLAKMEELIGDVSYSCAFSSFNDMDVSYSCASSGNTRLSIATVLRTRMFFMPLDLVEVTYEVRTNLPSFFSQNVLEDRSSLPSIVFSSLGNPILLWFSVPTIVISFSRSHYDVVTAVYSLSIAVHLPPNETSFSVNMTSAFTYSSVLVR